MDYFLDRVSSDSLFMISSVGDENRDTIYQIAFDDMKQNLNFVRQFRFFFYFALSISMFLFLKVYTLILLETHMPKLEFHGETKRLFEGVFGKFALNDTFVLVFLALWGALPVYLFLHGAGWNYKNFCGVFIACYAVAVPFMFTYVFNFAQMHGFTMKSFYMNS